ncbi:uncharacterized protein AruCF_4766 [Achromobacter ruhlandii]|nr:uncharacterized protein AruCF_4766 [Achromobacter ruhlandii]
MLGRPGAARISDHERAVCERKRVHGRHASKRRAHAKKPATLARYRLSAKGVGKHLQEFDHR